VHILASWWEGWKVSTTSQLFSCSIFMILFYLLLLYYMFAESLLYSVSPAMCDLLNPYDLLSPQHYSIRTGFMGDWVKVQTITPVSQSHLHGSNHRTPPVPCISFRRLRSKVRFFKKTRFASITLANSAGGSQRRIFLMI